MKRVNIAVVKGSEGYSLQVYDEKGVSYSNITVRDYIKYILDKIKELEERK